MPTVTRTSIDGLAGYINFQIPQELQQIKARIYGVQESTNNVDRSTLIDEIGIAAAVQSMVYTDAMSEEDAADPTDVEKELCHVCHNEIWDLGDRYGLNPHERRRGWLKTLRTISQIVRETYPEEQVAQMEQLDVHDFEFHASADDEESLESEGETS